MIKIILYMINLMIVIWVMEGLDLNKIFKQNRVYQARLMYLIIAISISYLITNFFYDFFLNCKIV